MVGTSTFGVCEVGFSLNRGISRIVSVVSGIVLRYFVFYWPTSHQAGPTCHFGLRLRALCFYRPACACAHVKNNVIAIKQTNNKNK
jgi:hypothetical protein